MDTLSHAARTTPYLGKHHADCQSENVMVVASCSLYLMAPTTQSGQNMSHSPFLPYLYCRNSWRENCPELGHGRGRRGVGRETTKGLNRAPHSDQLSPLFVLYVGSSLWPWGESIGTPFIDKETKALRGLVTCLRPPSHVAELGWPRSFSPLPSGTIFIKVKIIYGEMHRL